MGLGTGGCGAPVVWCVSSMLTDTPCAAHLSKTTIDKIFLIIVNISLKIMQQLTEAKYSGTLLQQCIMAQANQYARKKTVKFVTQK